ANSKIAGLKNDFDTNPTFAKFLERTEQDYLRLSATPGKYAKLKSAIGKMWETQPNWTDQQLRGIHVPVWIVDGDHDEAIKRDHSIYLAATIPQARLLFLPRVSHFAFLQDRRAFNGAVDCFLSALTAASRPLPERALTKSCAPSE
ncbi:MAG: alpha/beta hydrolase, partial [Tardiphaga sp.]